MNSIKLEVVDTANSGACHVKVLIDGSDCGILYLTDSELDRLNKMFLRCAAETGYDYVDIYSDNEQTFTNNS